MVGREKVAVAEVFDLVAPGVAPVVEDLAAQHVAPQACFQARDSRCSCPIAMSSRSMTSKAQWLTEFTTSCATTTVW